MISTAQNMSPRHPILKRLVERLRPRCLAFLGKAAYAAIQGRRELAWGRQPERFGGAAVWVLPNPSGRNLSFGLDALVAAYRELKLFDDVGLRSGASARKARKRAG